MSFTIGSLFDGSGGFPLAASLCGGIPKWASEIEPYPIAVTKSRFPNVKHLGSVTDINGGEIEPVDVITFGSPCQDLSVAGKRAGLKHEANGDDETTRSGLFMEAVRIIKEMREATNGVYPRFALWENVPGAFSSNKGEDFRIVLQELIQIVEPTAVMPEVPKNGWPYADSYCGDGWSIAYRVLDAQYWGVPQRRRRIYLVADFRGECAGAVSSQQSGLRGHFETGRTPWQTAAGDAESCAGAADCERKCVSYSFDALSSNSMKSSNPHSGCRQVEVAKCLDTTDPNPCKNQGGIAIVEQVPYTLKIRSGCEGGGKGALIQTDKSATLSTLNDQYLFQPLMTCLDDQGGSQISVRTDGKCPTLRAETHGNLPCVMSIENHPADSRVNIDDSGKVQTLTSRMGTGGGNVPMVLEPKVYESHPMDSRIKELDGVSPTVSAKWHKGAADTPLVAFQTYQKVTGPLMANSHPGSYTGQDAFNDMLVAGVDARNATEYPEKTGALQADAAHNLNSNNVVRIQYIVRRLTPTECARLQGFPDTWGHPDVKTELTDEEYQFWLNVRNTHAAINDKAVKEYTKDQMLKWYNSLHTDSSEYKMWGNGIALPCAFFIMANIADVMSEEKSARSKWLDELLGDCL